MCSRNIIPKRSTYLGVSKNRGTPKWMVYIGNPIKMDDLGLPLFSETPILKGAEFFPLFVASLPTAFFFRLCGCSTEDDCSGHELFVPIESAGG